VGKGVGVGEITTSCWFQHQLRAQGRTSCNAPKLGSRLSWDAGLSRDLMSQPCSTGSSQRKVARSVPIPAPPGFRVTCKT